MSKKIAKAAAAGLIGLVSLGIGSTALADTNIQASNSCEDCNAETGQANTTNSSESFTGQAGIVNVQDGDNTTESDQDANASSGDGVTGQVIGSAADGDTTIVASNNGKDNKVTTGDANAANFFGGFTGQLGILNVQNGDNETDSSQAADSTTGDGVTGQVIGVV